MLDANDIRFSSSGVSTIKEFVVDGHRWILTEDTLVPLKTIVLTTGETHTPTYYVEMHGAGGGGGVESIKEIVADARAALGEKFGQE